MKKSEGMNWISSARSMAPAIVMSTSARSATLAPRPRFAAAAKVSHGFSQISAN